MPLNNYLIIVVLFASIGNAFVIVSILINQKTRNPFGIFIINIAFVDFLIGAFLKSSFVVEEYFEGQQISGVHCYLMTSFITSAPTIVLTSLIVLSFYTLFSSIKKVSIEQVLTSENVFIVLFLIWTLCGVMSLIYHRVFGNYSNYCSVDDELLTVSVYANLMNILLLILINAIILTLQLMRSIQESIEMRRPDAVYNNLSVEMNSERFETNKVDSQSRKIVFILSLSFTLFWLPFYSIRAHYEWKDSKHSLNLIIFQLYAYIFGYFNSIITPIAILKFYPESRILLNKINELEVIEKLKIWKRFARTT